ncbi:MAG: tRNA 4-thiouridine(8) synthase ThiI [Methanolinea sp.]|nr:tRNA 4-thiouridine(8) synthase ThiI [Methanolinea sp.]
MSQGTGETGAAVMLRYGEIFLKSEPVRRQFVSLLLRNCEAALAQKGILSRPEVYRGRIFFRGGPPDSLAGVLSRVFGVVDVSVCRLTPPDPDLLLDAAVSQARSRLSPGMRFAVRARREGVEGITSQELAARVGEAILHACPGVRVDLGDPDYEIFVELREFGGVVYDTQLPGPGGLPWGTQGRVLALLSPGIDSPVAAWLMMKRGCEIDALYVSPGALGGRGALSGVLRNISALSTWCPGFSIRLSVVDAQPFYENLMDRAEPRLRCVICKRFMMMLASRFAEREGFLALCTGDNLGQVASQTLANLVVVSRPATLPVLRPLVTCDKQQIVALAKKIGTFNPQPGDLSCSVVPRTPATTSREENVKKSEERVGVGTFIDLSLERVTVYTALNGKVEREETSHPGLSRLTHREGG